MKKRTKISWVVFNGCIFAMTLAGITHTDAALTLAIANLILATDVE